MKKFMLAAAIVCAAACVQAATSWTFVAFNIPKTDGTDGWSGTARVSCDALDCYWDIAVYYTSSGGYLDQKVQKTDAGDPSQEYTFTLTMTDGNYTYNQTASGRMGKDIFDAWTCGAVSFAGGNAWVAAPEPTSGLLMLLGLAGLALKRKRA